MIDARTGLIGAVYEAWSSRSIRNSALPEIVSDTLNNGSLCFGTAKELYGLRGISESSQTESKQFKGDGILPHKFDAPDNALLASVAEEEAGLAELYKRFPGLQNSTFLGPVNERANIAIGETHRNDSPGDKLHWAYTQFHNKGSFDYKNRFTTNSEGLAAPEWVQDFGNFNYGAMLAAAGFTLEEAQKAAGMAQIKAGTSRKEWGTPLTGPPYGDDPKDQKQISAGFAWYQKYHPHGVNA